jgi:ZIP family zinc transporter
MTLTIIALAAFIATLIGGLLALRLRDSLHLILGFSAGAIIGVVFFELLPEALELTSEMYDAHTVFSFTTIGFICYFIFDRFFTIHSHHHGAELRSVAGAGSISLHSFVDGIGIGFAFQVSTEVGILVAISVLAHNFSDGINTVNMILRHHGEKARAIRWLAIDASAPVLGILASFLFTISDPTLGLILALFAGSFLYISASDLIPESFHEHPVHWTTVSTVAGVLALYLVTHLAH